MGEFMDKVVLVSGAGRGAGRAVAEAFAASGAILALNDLTPVNLDETLAHIHAGGGRAKDYIFDIAKKMPVQAMMEQVLADWGQIDVLVNCATVNPRVAILDMDEWDWHRTIDVNLGGPFWTMQVAGRVMREQGSGVIVNIASVPRGVRNSEAHTAVIASKMGLIGLTVEAAGELAPYRIRVHAVCSGIGRINLERMLAGQSWPLQDKGIMQGQELGGYVPQAKRLSTLEQVVDAALFLCSQAASHLTGQVVLLDS